MTGLQVIAIVGSTLLVGGLALAAVINYLLKGVLNQCPYCEKEIGPLGTESHVCVIEDDSQ